MGIKRLPGDVAAQVQSSVVITTLNAVVLGLVRNALDAGAARVAVTVDYSHGACVVDDDGVGIAPVEFSVEGGLGKSCYTSKFPPSSALHGRNGTFLASVANLALLTVVSRCANHGSAHALVIHNGHVLRRHAPASLHLSAAVSPTPHGTHVSVHDLFGCMPVRARQRPTGTEAAASLVAATARDWEELVCSMTALLLAWPSDVAVWLYDENGGQEKRRRRRMLGRPRSLALGISNGAGVDGLSAARLRTTQLLVQAGLCSGVRDEASWVPVSASTENVAVGGFVCLVPASSKQAQFLRIGVQPLSDPHHAGVLYDEINRIFAESDFGVDTDTVSDARNTSPADSEPAGTLGPLGRYVRVRKPHKAVDRWPMFSIGMDFSAPDAVAVDDVLGDHRQYLTVLKRLLRVMLEEFLGERGFYGKPVHPGSTRSQLASPAREINTSTHTRGKLSRPPKRGRHFLSWPRTKYAEPQSRKTPTATPGPHPMLPRMEHTSRFFSGACGDDKGGDAGSDSCADDGSLSSSTSAAWGEGDENVFISGNVRLSRACLEQATVINQVDEKFVLIRMPVAGTQSTGHAETVLSLVDQHAADERCHVEALFRSYHLTASGAECVARTTLLEKPLQFELTADEGQRTAEHRDVFRHWGLVYDIVEAAPGTADGSVLLRVHRLPASLAGRCSQEPQLVADLIRSEVWARSTVARPQPQTPSLEASKEMENPESWVTLFHGCPRGILRLLHSKACHSAIKFNDRLSHDECVDLVNRLRRCAFPFQCAHGRPSMVPLLNLGPETPFRNFPDGAWEEYIDG